MRVNPQLQEALEGVKKAVQGEREDELFKKAKIKEEQDFYIALLDLIL